ncbi:MAG: hypothetical protein GY708_03485 [Actinomycetia bacterium]|nr:hypothetical protein [Actinomycetes bacterium]MCP4958539.1 hypothetical protein [Actinomycetes bacterium]
MRREKKTKRDPKAVIWVAVAAVFVAASAMIGFQQEGAGASDHGDHDTPADSHHDDHGDSHDVEDEVHVEDSGH